jgi:hypothetical protein
VTGAPQRLEAARLAVELSRVGAPPAAEAANRAVERLLRLPVLASFAPSALDLRLVRHVAASVAARADQEPGLREEVIQSAIARFTGETLFRLDEDRELRTELGRGAAEQRAVRDAIGWLLLIWQVQTHPMDVRLTRRAYAAEARAPAGFDA